MTEAAEGAPGLVKPDVNSAPRADFQGFQRPDVRQVTEDGRMLDADGNELGRLVGAAEWHSSEAKALLRHVISHHPKSG